MFCIEKFSLSGPSVVGLSETFELEETQGKYFLSWPFFFFLVSYLLKLACLLFIYLFDHGGEKKI